MAGKETKMATGFVIEPGYQSGSLGTQDGWEILKLCAKDVVAYPEEFKKEVIRFMRHPPSDLDEYIAIYKADAGNPLAVGSNADCRISISASGGGVSRTIKEHVANAFCRMIMEKMHSHGCHVSISVV